MPVLVHESDGESGVASVRVLLIGPNGQSVSAPATLQAGGNQSNGEWAATLSIPPYAQQGKWRLSVETADNAGNSKYLSAAQLAAAGFSSEVEQSCAPDTKPPQLEGLELSTLAINTEEAARPVTVTVHESDDLSGVARVRATLSSGSQSYSASATRQSGTALNGTWICDGDHPSICPPGHLAAEHRSG